MQPRVLVVDDEALIRMSLSIALCREGYQVETAACGLEGMSLVAQNHYDLVILDLRLPDVSGMEVLHYTKKVSPGTKVLLVTASTNAPTDCEAEAEGAVGVVKKPFGLQSLTERTRRVIAAPGSQPLR